MAHSRTLSESNKLPFNLLLSKSNALVCHFDFWTRCASQLKLLTQRKINEFHSQTKSISQWKGKTQMRIK